MRFVILILSAFLFNVTSRGQQLKYKAFTVSDGLPSNYVYRCIEDNKGFLWVATDAGIARFDGKHFQLFTTSEGLPDNEVLAVVKENNGRIWVNCFRQQPAYFDEVKNRFIIAKMGNPSDKTKAGTAIMFLYALKNGGVIYTNEIGSYIFKDGKEKVYNTATAPQKAAFIIKENTDGTQLRLADNLPTNNSKTFISKIYLTRGNNLLDSIVINKSKDWDYIIPATDEGKLYYFNHSKNKCLIYTNLSKHPFHFKTDSINIPEPIITFGFTGTWLNFYASSGKIYVFDKQTFKQLFTISGNYAANSLFNDSKGNLWISTIDKGLVMYKKSFFEEVKMPYNFSHTSFFSITRKLDGTILAGNYYGEVLEANKKKTTINTLPQKSKTIFRQRKILLSQNKIFTFSETGIYVNYKRQVKSPSSALFYAKTAINYNDSIIIAGQVTGLLKLNTITEKVTVLHPVVKRITALAKTDDGMIYFGSTDGLYAYDYKKDTGWALNKSNQLFCKRVTAICCTKDNVLWVATAGYGVLAIRNNKIIFHITANEGIINNDIRSITTAGSGQIWVGTGQGISIINYKLTNSNADYNVQNLSVNDGLTNNVVNEMQYQKDTIYAATGNGITIIPANISIPKFNIPLQLIRLSINQRDTIIENSYKLAYNQNNIQMQFAGIELSGHFKNFKYTLDNNKNWITLDENTLTLQLNSGAHTLQVRAVDVNGNISDKIRTIQFNIATPFWKTLWFWLTVVCVLQIAVIYLVNQRQKRRKEAALAQKIAGVQIAKLEQQAFTSLMNPHFIFNALNSIQHYINVQDRQSANRYLSDFASLIRKNFEAAQQSFTPLEQEIENIKIYMRLEQMRFCNYFTYQIIVAETLEMDDWMIPTMILQPVLENALLHGIMPSKITGEIIIDLKEQDNNLHITITDNGIGIANSLALKPAGNHKSHGMELIKKRIAALSRFGVHAITFSVSPVFMDKQNPGNRMILFIPHQLHHAWLTSQNA
jgi:ligand-binding sensor domain-containing protein/two-component sensor histidine kinase